MDELTDIYKRIEYLRNNGVKMKEIADRVDMAPSVLSALYSSVLPAYIDLLKTRTPDEALDEALALVNNVSKKRLLNNVGSVRLLLQEMEPERACGYVENIGRDGESTVTCTLEELQSKSVNMFTTVFVGNSRTRIQDGKLITPRGYKIEQ